MCYSCEYASVVLLYALESQYPLLHTGTVVYTIILLYYDAAAVVLSCVLQIIFMLCGNSMKVDKRRKNG